MHRVLLLALTVVLIAACKRGEPPVEPTPAPARAGASMPTPHVADASAEETAPPPQSERPPNGDPSAPLPQIGIPECDACLSEYRHCIENKFPEATRAAMLDALYVSASRWVGAAQTVKRYEFATACVEARDATAAFGCVFGGD